MNYWIFKSEPSAYSFADLERDGITTWDGVRNYQARNNLRQVKPGDQVMIYHSMGPKELVGIAEVASLPKPDLSATLGDWTCVEIRPRRRLAKPLNLAAIKNEDRLRNLQLIKQSRLSVCPVNAQEWAVLLELTA